MAFLLNLLLHVGLASELLELVPASGLLLKLCMPTPLCRSSGQCILLENQLPHKKESQTMTIIIIGRTRRIFTTKVLVSQERTCCLHHAPSETSRRRTTLTSVKGLGLRAIWSMVRPGALVVSFGKVPELAPRGEHLANTFLRGEEGLDVSVCLRGFRLLSRGATVSFWDLRHSCPSARGGRNNLPSS